MPLRDTTEARNAAHDALFTGLGQIAGFLAALLFSVFVPRLLGAAIYGEWMLYRGLAVFWLLFLSLGDRSVMASYYLPCLERGDHASASRIFRLIALLRLAIAPLFMAGAVWMLMASTSTFRTPAAAFCLALTILLKVLQLDLNTLLFGRRHLGRIALLDTLQSTLLPLLILLAWRTRDPAWIPWAALASDILLLLIAFLLTPLRRRRPVPLSPAFPHDGKPEPPRLWNVFRYAILVAIAENLILSLNNLLCYLMDLRGYPPEIIGRIGLATRCVWIVQAGLITIGTALMPALSVVILRHGNTRMQLWQDFVSRLGLALLILLAGNLLLLGPWGVRLVWGPDYAGLTPFLALSLLSVGPVWLASQWTRLFLLKKNASIYLIATLLYAAVLCTVFFLLPPDAAGWSPILALIAAGSALALVTFISAIRAAISVRWLLRFLLPALLLLPAIWGMTHLPPGPLPFIAALLWTLMELALLFLTRALGFREITDLLTALRPARK